MLLADRFTSIMGINMKLPVSFKKELHEFLQDPKKMIKAITTISCVGVIAVVALEIVRPGQDHMPVVSILIGFLAPTLVGLLGLMKSQENSESLLELHRRTMNMEEQSRQTIKKIDNIQNNQ